MNQLETSIRRGWLGLWDRFIGPKATVVEVWLILSAAVLCAFAVVGFALYQGLGWSIGQLIVAALLAMDVAGGVAANASQTTKRWYHRVGQSKWQHFGFVFVHVVQIGLYIGFFGLGQWQQGLMLFVYLLLATFVVLHVPYRYQLPLACLAVLDSLLLQQILVVSDVGMEWFFPALVIKLVVCHIIPPQENQLFYPVQGERS
jgi:hypothetical protein